MIRALPFAALLLLAPPVMAAPAIEVVRSADDVKSLVEKTGADGKPVVVHFFATWCGPCRKEMPVLRKTIQRVESRGAHVLLFSLDEFGAEKSAVPKFLAKHAVRARSWLLDAPDPDLITKAIDPAWTAALPATFVFKNGVRTHSVLGPLKNERALDNALK